MIYSDHPVDSRSDVCETNSSQGLSALICYVYDSIPCIYTFFSVQSSQETVWAPIKGLFYLL